ncbi:MAG TPA: hypothetical protein VL356_01715 [Acidocella sp.]|jgi:hypothetical protein|nr:hypothetical protein [Acidocella sp.]
MSNSVTVSVNGAGTVGVALAVTGTVAPAGDTVQVQLSTSATTLPTGAWTTASTANGTFATTLTPVAGGTWYVWAYDPVTGAQAVSGAVLVASPALQTVAALPIPTAVVASLLGGSAAGETPDELPAAGAPSGTDTALVAQSGKNILAQPFSVIAQWLATQLPGLLLPSVPVTASLALETPLHNQRILVVEAAGVTLTPLLASLGDGFACTVINASGTTVALSGMTTNTGATQIAAGGIARIYAYGSTPTVVAAL